MERTVIALLGVWATSLDVAAAATFPNSAQPLDDPPAFIMGGLGLALIALGTRRRA